MPKITLPSQKADGTQNYVVVREPDDFLAEELFAIHRAVRVPTGGETYSPGELNDDAVNAFLGAAITEWSYDAPVPREMNVAAPDKVIGKVMKGKDWGVLRRKVKPLMDELEGSEDEDPKALPAASPGSSSTT
jgi:hypothetical protein